MKSKTSGKFRQEKNGKWSIDTKILINDEWKHLKRTGYRTLSDAKADYENMLDEFKQKNSIKELTFDDIIEDYKKMREITVTETTMGCDDSIYHKHLTDFFGKKISACLNKSFVQRWYSEMVNNIKLSYDKKSKIRTRFKNILLFAYNNKYIDAPTFQDCDIILYPIKNTKAPKKEKEVWDNADETKFLHYVKKTNLKDYVMFALFFNLGARISEFLAIQGKSINFDKGKITINQQIICSDGGAKLTERLKTRESYRDVIVYKSLMILLKDYVEEFDVKDNDFLFYTYTKSKPISKTEFRRKLYRYCDLADVPKITPHSSRHQQAIKLASVCENIQQLEAAARLLGHSPSMFANTYANHQKDSIQESLVEKIYNA